MSKSKEFEDKVRQLIYAKWGVKLEEKAVNIGNVAGCEMKFDYVSTTDSKFDGCFAGDAKDYNVKRNFSAEKSGISEYVWLLQKVDAVHKFLVFRGNRQIPESWLRRWRSLAEGIEFYFVEDNELVRL